MDFTGGLGSSHTAKTCIAAAIASVDKKGAAVAAGETNWRANYYKHTVAVNAASLQSPAAALSVSRAGLAALREHFSFGGQSMSCGEAVSVITAT